MYYYQCQGCGTITITESRKNIECNIEYKCEYSFIKEITFAEMMAYITKKENNEVTGK